MLDTLTVSVCVALVVIVSSVTFIVDTLLWREDAAGRVWSTALTSGMGSMVAVVLWASTHIVWFAVVINALYATAWTLIWSGLRVYNGKTGKFGVAAILAASAGGLALVPQPFPETPGTFLTTGIVAVVSALIVRETLVGRLQRKRFAIPFTFSFAFMAGYTASVFLVGCFVPDHPMLEPGFISLRGYLIIIMLVTVIAVANATLLRAEGIIMSLTNSRSVPWEALSTGILTPDAFEAVGADWLNRARRHDANLAMFVLLLDDRTTVEQAFGSEEFASVIREWRKVISEYAPPHAELCAMSSSQMAVMTPVASEEELIRWASDWRSGLLETSHDFPVGFHPTISIGASTTVREGWTYHALFAAAERAAEAVSLRGGDATLISNSSRTE